MFHKFTLFLMALCLAVPAWAQTRMIAHVTREGGGFTTTIQVENLSAQDQDYSLAAFKADGAAYPVFQGALTAGEVRALSVADVVGPGQDISHFSFDGDDRVKVSVVYDFAAGNGSPAHVRANDEQASIWRIFPGDWDHVFDGIAIVNRGSVETELWVAQKDFSGKVLNAVKIADALAPNAKTLFVIGSPDGSPFTVEPGAYFEVSGNQLLSITALRGTLASAQIGLLWANEARGLSQSLTTRDEMSVWFIKGGDLHDVHEMMGYQVARDRLWQAETFRRQANGRLAEVFGSSMIASDELSIDAGYLPEELDAFWAELDEETRTVIQAYVDGFNRRIGEVNNVPPEPGGFGSPILPLEFKTFGILEIEPWTHRDVMSWLALVQRNFTLTNMGFEQIQNAAIANQLIALVGQENIPQAAMMFDDIRWLNDPTSPTMIAPTPEQIARAKTRAAKKDRQPWPGAPRADLRRAAGELWSRIDSSREELKKIGAYVKSGSFAWAISGEHTDTGWPMLYAGPQMGFEAPGLVVEGSIESDELTVSGMFLPGIPASIVGRTPNHAWSLQIGHAPVFDYYFEEPQDISIVKFVTIRVAGAPDVQKPVARGKYGPVLIADPLLSFKYAHRGKEWNLSKGILGMARAKNMDEFGEAVKHIATSQHICYVDSNPNEKNPEINGNIAYWMTGRNPVRPEGIYRFPQGFFGVETVREYDIEVVNPLPHDRNSDAGYYGGWNNKAAIELDDIHAIHSFGRHHRAHVIQAHLEKLIDSGEKISFDDLTNLGHIVNASYSLIGLGGQPWLAMRDDAKFAEIVRENPTDERLAALEVLESWNGNFPDGEDSDTLLFTTNGSDGWVLQDAWLQAVIDLTFEDELGPRASAFNPNADLIRLNTIINALADEPGIVNNYDWFANADPAMPQTGEAIVLQAFDETIARLGEQPWGATARGFILFQHSFLGTVQATPFGNRATYVQAIAMGPNGPARIDTMFPLGQSGTLLLGPDGIPRTEAGTVVGSGQPQPEGVDHFVSLRDIWATLTLRPFPIFP